MVFRGINVDFFFFLLFFLFFTAVFDKSGTKFHDFLVPLFAVY